MNPTPEQWERSREITGHHQGPPCGCIRYDDVASVWMQYCDCRNSGDLERVCQWVQAANMESTIAYALAEEAAKAEQRGAEKERERVLRIVEEDVSEILQEYETYVGKRLQETLRPKLRPEEPR